MRIETNSANVTPMRADMPVGITAGTPLLPDHSKPVTYADLLLIAARIDEIRRDEACSTAEAMVIAIVEDLNAA